MTDADVVIIGAGPAGLQAAIHSARRKASTVVIGKASGSAASGIRLENYLGLAGDADGSELLRVGREQAESFGARVVDANVVSTAVVEGGFEIAAETGEVFRAKAVVLATGTSRVKLGVPGEKEFGMGRGVSYCASCDCNFYKGKRVAIVGGESEAAIDADLMTRYASETWWVSPSFDVDANLAFKAEQAGAKRVQAKVRAIVGDKTVEGLELEDGRTIPVDGVFIELGGRSSADLAMDLGVMPEMDDTIKVDRSCATSAKGVFACGDVTGRPWQVAKAVGEGMVAGDAAARYAKGAR